MPLQSPNSNFHLAFQKKDPHKSSPKIATAKRIHAKIHYPEGVYQYPQYDQTKPYELMSYQHMHEPEIVAIT